MVTADALPRELDYVLLVFALFVSCEWAPREVPCFGKGAARILAAG